MADIAFKGYCWSIGTTSYRTVNFNKSIETQMQMLDEFRKIPGNESKSWRGSDAFQSEYYYFLKKNNFVKGDAPRPYKDAREKTSGLKDIGLMTDDRILTEAGEKLLEIANSGKFDSDNMLELPRDSYVFFKQLLKTSNMVDGKCVRPFIVFSYVVSKLGYLTNDEFTYLLPLCIDSETTQFVIEEIMTWRKSGISFDSVIIDVLMKKENYQNALQLFLDSDVDEELFCVVGMNRKSKSYDKGYLAIYKALYDYVFGGRKEAVYELYEATKGLSNVGGDWRKLLFNTTSKVAIKNDGAGAFKAMGLFRSDTEAEFKRKFFMIMHLIKAKSTLQDYFDLNRRYFRATDVVIFQDRKVKFDILPKCYFEAVAENLFNEAFTETDLLERDVELFEISPALQLEEDELYRLLGREVGVEVRNSQMAKKVIRDERYERLNKLIDEKFNKDNLIRLFGYFEERADDTVFEMVTDNADVPTIFEYILGIAWYEISERKGDVLEFMNLSLEADLLPKTHAGGGEADIVWKYEETGAYPKHTLLLEATLADGNNQRRMEMEPVSRHLGDYRIANPSEEAYCVFASTYLNPNVISDFRARKTMMYYSLDGSKSIDGMKILPLHTRELVGLLDMGVKYPEVYAMFHEAHSAEEAPAAWYTNNIERRCHPENVTR